METVIIEHFGDHHIFNHKFPIYMWQSHAMPAGQYTFPFSFLLNNNLPGTFYEKGNDWSADIYYEIEAEVESNS